MYIPNKIKLMGREIDIINDDLACDIDGHLGQSLLTESKIIYQKLAKGKTLKQDCINVTILHEIIHFMLWVLGYDYNDEKFIERFSELLYQVIQQIDGKNIKK